jgi:hypothetical protein
MPRGRFGWLVILPNPELVTVRLGASNSGRLKALKD